MQQTSPSPESPTERDEPDHARASALPCPNCEHPGPGRFCPGCGQSQSLQRQTLRAWTADFLDDTLSLEARLPRTLITLVANPGRLTREWLDGRRARFVPPLRLYLLCSLLMFSATLAIGLAKARWTGVPLGWSGTDGDAALRQLAPQLLFALVPAFALLLHLFFRRARFLFTEHLTLALHVHAFWFLALVPLLAFAGSSVLSAVVQVGLIVWMMVHLVLACRRVYGGGALRVVAKSVTLFLGYSIFGVALLYSIAEWQSDGPEQRAEQAHALLDRWTRLDATDIDPGAAASARRQALRAFRRLELRAAGAHEYAHLAELILADPRPEPRDLRYAQVAAEQGLAEEPDHLLALSAAAQAAEARGDCAAAERYGKRFAEGVRRQQSAMVERYGAEHARHLAAGVPRRGNCGTDRRGQVGPAGRSRAKS